MSQQALLAVAAIIARLQAIHPTAGYHTTAGLRVQRAERSADPEGGATLPRIAVHMGDEQVEALTGRRYRCARDILIEATLAQGTTDDAVTALEHLIEDIQRAVEQPDETLGGLVHTLNYAGMQAPEPPQEGSDIGYLQIRYVIEYDRSYGA